MFKLLKLKMTHLLVLFILLIPISDLISQSSNAIIMTSIVEIGEPIKSDNGKRTTTKVTMYTTVENVRTKEKKEMITEGEGTGKTTEESVVKAIDKTNKNLYQKILIFLGIKKKKDGDNVMLNGNGEGDYKGGGEIIIILGPGGKGIPMPTSGDTGTKTLKFDNVNQFLNNGQSEIGLALEEIAKIKK